jgi:hypothetical protein
MKYNWQLSDWPDFSYNLQTIENVLFALFFELANGKTTVD